MTPATHQPVSVDGALDAGAPWPGAGHTGSRGRALYTEAERQRRDATVWTLVQGILAPVQFLVFLVSLALVLRYLATGSGYEAATVSIVIKTLVLYTIMVTGDRKSVV
mgnify:CR=1 FL=1